MPSQLGGLQYFDLYLTQEPRYDILNDSWSDNLPIRPFTGHHHAVEIIDGKFYLFGSLGGAGGTVQWYDPGTGSWSVGDTMPWSGGSIVTSLINGMVYAAGGIVGSGTVANVWRYDPSLDQWDASPLASPDHLGHHGGSSERAAGSTSTARGVSSLAIAFQLAMQKVSSTRSRSARWLSSSRASSAESARIAVTESV